MQSRPGKGLPGSLGGLYEFVPAVWVCAWRDVEAVQVGLSKQAI